MSTLFGFMFEKTIINSIPILLASLAVAYISGPFLKNIGIGKYWRILIYSIIGVVAGLLTYSAYDIPDRSFEAMELMTLTIGMLVFSLALVGAVVILKNRNAKV